MRIFVPIYKPVNPAVYYPCKTYAEACGPQSHDLHEQARAELTGNSCFCNRDYTLFL